VKPFVHWSPSQVDTFTLCNRKWWLNKIFGLEIPQHPSAALGQATHTELETYLEHGDPKVLGPIAKAGLEFLPKPGTVLIEYDIAPLALTAGGLPALGRIDAGATVQALEAAKPDAIFNVTFGADLINFVRQGNTRGLFEGRLVASMLTGEPEYMDPLGAETPVGWIVTGYPHQDIATPEHTKFRDAYRARFNDYPRLGSVVGYDTVMAIAAAITRAGTTDNEKVIEAMKGLKFMSAFGPVEFRAIDHQATLGAYVGRTAVKDGKGVMTNWRYADGAKYLPSDDVVKTLRPQ
jgi:hypothetical protein